MNLKSHLMLLAAVVLLFAHVGPAFASEYFEEDGVAIGVYDPVANFTEMKRVNGAGFHALYEG